MKFCLLCIGIRKNKRKGSEFSEGRANLPLPAAPIDHPRRILAGQGRSRWQMRIVKSNQRRRYPVALSLNIDISGAGVANRERPGFFVESVSLTLQIVAASNRPSSDSDGIGNKVQAKYIGRVCIEG